MIRLDGEIVFSDDDIRHGFAQFDATNSGESLLTVVLLCAGVGLLISGQSFGLVVIGFGVLLFSAGRWLDPSAPEAVPVAIASEKMSIRYRDNHDVEVIFSAVSYIRQGRASRSVLVRLKDGVRFTLPVRCAGVNVRDLLVARGVRDGP